MKILFVCLGNICRSPIAEGIFADKARKSGLTIEADSAGFESFHRGDPADQRSVAVARENGVSLNGHAARMFTVRDFDHNDRIYVMDRGNYNDVMGMARDTEDEEKVDFIMNLVYPGEDRPVPDPWTGNMDSFRKVYKMLNEACEILVKQISPDNIYYKSSRP